MIRTLMKNKNKNQLLILVTLGLFAICVGLWGNYRQLWLASNNLTAAAIGRVMSVASIVAALSLLFYTKKFSINKIKKGITITLVLKLFISLLLLLVDKSNNLFLIKFLSFFDIACESIILSSIYPFMMCYQKNDELYGKKDVVENFGKTSGVLLGCILFGKIVFNYKIGFKTCLLISIFFTILAIFTILLIEDNQNIKMDMSKENIIKYLKGNRLAMIYLIYNSICNVSFNVVVGLKMLMLVNFGKFSTHSATVFILILAVVDIIIGALSINILKSKNDYINISIKFLVRLILFILVAISDSFLVMLCAISYCLVTSVAYGSIVNGHMINKVDNNYILDFTVINHIGNLIGEAIGILIAGIMFDFGFKYIFISAIPIMIVQLIMAYYLIYNKRKNIALKPEI